jgi:hypothetical protein
VTIEVYLNQSRYQQPKRACGVLLEYFSKVKTGWIASQSLVNEYLIRSTVVGYASTG